MILSPVESPCRRTQPFGVNQMTYRRFGLKGHDPHRTTSNSFMRLDAGDRLKPHLGNTLSGMRKYLIGTFSMRQMQKKPSIGFSLWRPNIHQPFCLSAAMGLPRFIFLLKRLLAFTSIRVPSSRIRSQSLFIFSKDVNRPPKIFCAWISQYRPFAVASLNPGPSRMVCRLTEEFRRYQARLMHSFEQYFLRPLDKGLSQHRHFMSRYIMPFPNAQ